MELPGGKPGELPTGRSLGVRLHHYKGRVLDGKYIDHANKTRPHRWLVRKAE